MPQMGLIVKVQVNDSLSKVQTQRHKGFRNLVFLVPWWLAISHPPERAPHMDSSMDVE
jgi:hypothetical protein